MSRLAIIDPTRRNPYLIDSTGIISEINLNSIGVSHDIIPAILDRTNIYDIMINGEQFISNLSNRSVNQVGGFGAIVNGTGRPNTIIKTNNKIRKGDLIHTNGGITNYSVFTIVDEIIDIKKYSKTLIYPVYYHFTAPVAARRVDTYTNRFIVHNSGYLYSIIFDISYPGNFSVGITVKHNNHKLIYNDGYSITLGFPFIFTYVFEGWGNGYNFGTKPKIDIMEKVEIGDTIEIKFEVGTVIIPTDVHVSANLVFVYNE